jgi:hypothetical protein
MIGLRRASDGERLCAFATANPRAGSFRSVVEVIDRVNLDRHGGACLFLKLCYRSVSQRFNPEPRLGSDGPPNGPSQPISQPSSDCLWWLSPWPSPGRFKKEILTRSPGLRSNFTETVKIFYHARKMANHKLNNHTSTHQIMVERNSFHHRKHMICHFITD